MATTPNLDKSSAEYSQNLRSYKTKAAAIRYADLNARAMEPTAKHGEVFATDYWNGGYNVPVWLLYDVSVTDEGFTTTVYRWQRVEEDLTCVHCGEEIVETEDGLLLHADETYDHLARKA